MKLKHQMQIKNVYQAEESDAAEIALCLAELGYGTSAKHISEKLRELEGSSVDIAFIYREENSKIVLDVVSVYLLSLFHETGFLGRITSLAVRSQAQRQGGCESMISVQSPLLSSCQ